MPNAKTPTSEQLQAFVKKLSFPELIALARMIDELEKPAVPKLVTKSELMAQVIAGKSHECFDHTIVGTFDVTMMREHSPILGKAGAIEQIVTLVAPIAANMIRNNRDFEPARVKELPLEAFNDPVIGVLCPDGETVLIDGTHRVLALEARGEELVRMYLWSLELAEVLGRPADSWGKIPGVEWGDPDFFAKKHGENNGE